MQSTAIDPVALWQLLIGRGLRRQDTDDTRIPRLFRLGRAAIVQSTEPTAALSDAQSCPEKSSSIIWKSESKCEFELQIFLDKSIFFKCLS